jgi:peptidoglycan/xylan/chitin deacetylase (PgdA/CDA1 family)
MIFLSFDIEEFDNPFPCSQDLSFNQQLEISEEGTNNILDLLVKQGVTATFFCTVNFAQNASYLVRRMIDEGHEVASHGYYHNRFSVEHLKLSKDALEALTGEKIFGFRMPNMGNLEASDLTAAGYRYNSSLNPTFLPGKYNNFTKPRRIFLEDSVYQIPASVSPILRIPLFWLALHVFPVSFYKGLSDSALKQDGYLNLYFHPWEFIDLQQAELDLPSYVKRNSGAAMEQRLGTIIEYFKAKGISFGHLRDCPDLFFGKQ